MTRAQLPSRPGRAQVTPADPACTPAGDPATFVHSMSSANERNTQSVGNEHNAQSVGEVSECESAQVQRRERGSGRGTHARTRARARLYSPGTRMCRAATGQCTPCEIGAGTAEFSLQSLVRAVQGK